MTDQTDKHSPDSAASRNPADYEVGYGKPPRHTRFEKGRSGNPAGRPKGASKSKEHKEFLEVIREEGARDLPGTVDGTTTAQAVVRSVFISAVKGDSAARKLIMPYLVEAFAQATEYPKYEAPKIDLSILTDEELAILEKVIKD